MSDQEGPENPIIIDGKFEDISNNSGYQDGAMAAAFQKAGITPESANTSQQPKEQQTSESYTDEALLEKARINAYAEAITQSQNTVAEKPQEVEARKPVETVDSRMKDLSSQLEKTDPSLAKKFNDIIHAFQNTKVQEAITDAIKENKHQEALESNRKANAGMVSRPTDTGGLKKMEEDAQRVIRENEVFEKRYKYNDKDGNLVEIPLPIREEMDLVFDENNKVFKPESAEKYGAMENELYSKRMNEKINELREKGWNEENINSYMKVAKYEIKEGVQQYVKGTVTRDMRSRIIERILNEPEKYRNFIDPTTGKVISSIDDENIIGYILGQKVYPGWMEGEKQAEIEATIKKATDRGDVQVVERIEKKENKIYKHLGLIGGVLGFGTAIVGGATIGGYAVLGGAAVSLGALGAEKYANWRISKLTQKLNSAKTQEEKTSIEKRLETWNKVRNIADKTRKFFSGFALGAGIGSAISNLFMGGEGLASMLQNGSESSQFAQANMKGNLQHSQTGETITTPTNEPLPPIENMPSDGVLVRNGRVDLPGSAWDGNLGNAPTQGLPNGVLNHSNFVGGATEMGAFNLESALQGSGVTRTMLTNNLQTNEIHRLLNIFQSNPSISLNNALQSINTEGARNLLSIITP